MNNKVAFACTKEKEYIARLFIVQKPMQGKHNTIQNHVKYMIAYACKLRQSTTCSYLHI